MHVGSYEWVLIGGTQNTLQVNTVEIHRLNLDACVLIKKKNLNILNRNVDNIQDTIENATNCMV